MLVKIEILLKVDTIENGGLRSELVDILELFLKGSDLSASMETPATT